MAEDMFPYSGQKVSEIWSMLEAFRQINTLISLQLNHMPSAAYTILFPRSLKQSPGIIISVRQLNSDKKGQDY